MDNTEVKKCIVETAELAAKSAVDELLVSLGVQITNPLEMQKDFAALREMREHLHDPGIADDLRYLRELRINFNSVKKAGMFTIVTILIGGLMTMIWLGFKHKLGLGG